MGRGLGANSFPSGKRKKGPDRPALRGEAATSTRQRQAVGPEKAYQRWRFMVLREGTPYTFSQILEQNSETEETLAELGYRFRSAPLSLQSKEDPRFAAQVEQMRAQMRERLPFVPMKNEASARAFYVTPVLFAVLDQVRFKMNIEYAVAGGRLRGRVDYLLRGRHDLVAAGVMNEEMDSGFRKLAVQMVAVSEQLAMPTVEPVHPRRARKALRAGRAFGGPKTVGFAKDVQTRLFGVVTAGPVWQFGVLDRGQKTVTKDTEAYQLPRDLGRLVGILAGLLGEIESEQDDFKREGERLSWANS